MWKPGLSTNNQIGRQWKLNKWYNRSRLFLLTQQPEDRLLDQMRTILPRPGPSQPALYPSVHQPKFNYSELGRAIPAAPIHTVAFPTLGILHTSDSSPEMSRRNQISKNLKGQLEKIKHQGPRNTNVDRPSAVGFYCRCGPALSARGLPY